MDYLEQAFVLAEKIAGYSPTALRLAKQVLNRIEDMNLKEGYQFEQGFTVKASGHPDSKEALAAFKERRRANFQTRTPDWTITLAAHSGLRGKRMIVDRHRMVAYNELHRAVSG